MLEYRRHEHLREEDADGAAGDREDRAFGEQELKQPCAARTERRAEGNLATSAAAWLATRLRDCWRTSPSRTSPTAPSRSNSGRWSGPDVSSRSGIATTPIESSGCARPASSAR